MWKRTSGTQGRQLEEGMIFFSQTLWIDFLCINLTFPPLTRAIFSFITHCLYEVHLSIWFFPCIWVSKSSASLQCVSLISVLMAETVVLEPYFHFPQRPKVTQIVLEATLNRTQLIKRGPVASTLLLSEVVLPLIINLFKIKCLEDAIFVYLLIFIERAKREGEVIDTLIAIEIKA